MTQFPHSRMLHAAMVLCLLALAAPMPVNGQSQEAEEAEAVVVPVPLRSLFFFDDELDAVHAARRAASRLGRDSSDQPPAVRFVHLSAILRGAGGARQAWLNGVPFTTDDVVAEMRISSIEHGRIVLSKGATRISVGINQTVDLKNGRLSEGPPAAGLADLPFRRLP